MTFIHHNHTIAPYRQTKTQPGDNLPSLKTRLDIRQKPSSSIILVDVIMEYVSVMTRKHCKLSFVHFNVQWNAVDSSD